MRVILASNGAFVLTDEEGNMGSHYHGFSVPGSNCRLLYLKWVSRGE